MPKKSERGDPLEFCNIHSVADIKKLKGVPLGTNFSPCMACYAEKEEKPFWFSSIGQMIQFGTTKICRSSVELFWSLRMD